MFILTRGKYNRNHGDKATLIIIGAKLVRLTNLLAVFLIELQSFLLIFHHELVN